MVKSSLLFVSVITLFCFIVIGYLLRKTKIIDGSFAKNLSLYVLYIAQGAMLIHGFIVEFDKTVFIGLCWVFLFSLVSHLLFYVIAVNMFKKTPERIRNVLRFGVVFSNAGYMGIPVISDVFGSEYVIYATFYVVLFNVFCYSLGRLIYTNDKKYISVKAMVINPAVISIIIGFILFITGAGGWIRHQIELDSGIVSRGLDILYSVLTTLKNTVAPVTMMVIGCRLADINFKGILKDKYLYPFLFIRHFLFPLLMWSIMRLLGIVGIFNDSVTMAIVLILNSTPAAAATTMFAELYGGDSPYAGKLVAISTLCSVATMPIVSYLLLI